MVSLPLEIVVRPVTVTTEVLLEKVRREAVAVFLDGADSESVGTGQGRYSFLGYCPSEILTREGDVLRYCCGEACQTGTVDQLSTWLNRMLMPRPYRIHYPDDVTASRWKDIPFFGGAMGYIGYQGMDRMAAQYGVQNRTTVIGERRLPLIWLGWFTQCVVVDHHLGEALHAQVVFPPLTFPEVKTFFEDESRNSASSMSRSVGAAVLGVPQYGMDETAFAAAVETGKGHIREGDCYQLNLSHRISRAFSGDSIGLYASLRQSDPQPFAAYLKTPFGPILSFSPERFFQVQGRTITTAPIKGTAKRVSDPVADSVVAETLFACDKNDAELMMIVDLLRNDIGQCCELGSVQVSIKKALQTSAHVHHLVSTIQGVLRQDVSPVELLDALHPGGSITGAPKHRVRQLIAQIETVPRQVYTGTIGYWGLGGCVDTSIAIRTCYVSDGYLHYHTGAGITAGSDPEAEWRETLAKAEGFLRTQKA